MVIRNLSLNALIWKITLELVDVIQAIFDNDPNKSIGSISMVVYALLIR